VIEKATDALKSHYVLEFLNLKEDHTYSESVLESAIIDKLEHFMMELGKVSYSRAGSAGLRSKGTAFTLTWCFTTGCCSVSCFSI
jgi:hypothetical protein